MKIDEKTILYAAGAVVAGYIILRALKPARPPVASRPAADPFGGFLSGLGQLFGAAAPAIRGITFSQPSDTPSLPSGLTPPPLPTISF